MTEYDRTAANAAHTAAWARFVDLDNELRTVQEHYIEAPCQANSDAIALANRELDRARLALYDSSDRLSEIDRHLFGACPNPDHCPGCAARYKQLQEGDPQYC